MANSLPFLAVTILALTDSFSRVEAGGAIGDKCYYNEQCTATRSSCRLNSPSCGGKTCACVPGFVVGADGTCKRKVILGGPCNLAGDLCTSENSDCISNTCQCTQGYKTGLKGNDCVSWQKSARYGGSCSDSTDCYYGMVCTNSVCACTIGQKAVSDYDCVSRSIGDACASNDDCSLTPNSICSSNKCNCQGGYRGVIYMTSMEAPTKLSYACIPNIESLKKEGAQCSNTIGASGTQVCMRPFVCTQCDNSGFFYCGRVVPLYIKGANVRASVYLTAISSSLLVLVRYYL